MRGSRVARLVVLAVVSCAALVGCGPDDGPDKGPEASPSGTGPDLANADLWLSFEDGTLASEVSPSYADANGGPAVGTVVVADGGEVRTVTGADGGSAVAFPEVCDEPAGCARAMIEVTALPALDPGDRDFEYGAQVWLAPDQTTSGSNIVQKGRFGTDGGQWKLQVDNDAGEPSCVVRGDAPDAEPLVVRSKVSISDSSWHQVTCRRDADGISIEVDGERADKAGVTGSVENESPLRVGAPGVGDGDDQFHGLVDDVYLIIAP